MAGKLSFSIAINLLTENFKRGTSSVKNGLRSMQMQVLTFAAALGAGGIGLTDFVTRLIDVARETSRVTTALKNVSGGMGQFADNQRFLLDMAKKYGLEINALTGNFAKFTAASQVSGMSMANQRKIFESVSRACTAFGMSADDSNGVFLALSQMMSKGKISSEELRLQMGERLPIALQAMAKAAGVSVGGLDKLMKQGKLMSKDVLPGFADALNEMIPNVDTDNIETSVNRLKNAFTEFTNGTGIQSAYKGIIDWLTGAVQSAGENIKNIVIGTVAVISGIIAKSVTGWWGAMASSAAGLEAAALRSNTKLIAATATRIAAEIALEEAKVAANNATGTAALAAKMRVIQAEKALIAASAAEQVAIGNVKDAELKVLDAKRLADVKTTANALAAITRRRVAAEIELEAAKTGVITANSNQILAAQTRLATAQKTLAKLTTQEVAAQEAAKAATIQAASVKSAGWWSRAYTTMKAGAAKLVVSLQTMWSTFAPIAIISALTWIISKFIAIRQQAKETAAIFSNYLNQSRTVTHTPEIIQLKVLQDLYNKTNGNLSLKQQYLNKINSLLGKELKSNEDINSVINDRIKLLEATAKVDYHTREKISAQEEINQIFGKYGGSEGYEKAIRKQAKIEAKRNPLDNWANDFNSVTQDRNKINELVKKVNRADSEIKVNIEYAAKHSDGTPPPGGGEPDDKKTALQKAEEKYAQSIRELNAKAEIEKLSKNEYNKALDELNASMYIDAKGSGDKQILESKYLQNLQKAVANPLYSKGIGELEELHKKYAEEEGKLTNQLKNKQLTEKEYQEELRKLLTETSKAAGAISGVELESQAFIAAMQFNAKWLTKKPDMPKMESRDKTFDYKKSKADIAGEELDVAKRNLDKLKETAKGNVEQFSKELNAAMQNVTDLEQALKIATVIEDVKKLREELSDGIYSGMKDVASSADRLVSSFQNLDEVFDPESEASGWERLMAVWSALTNAVDSFMSICKMVENLTELTNKLALAQQTEAAINTTTTAVKVANAGTETTAELTALGTQTTAEAAASATKATAASVEMAAKSTSAYAAIPFVGVGLAAAQIVAMQAMIAAAAIPKFATGGIYMGGTATGDKGLARLNKGEMILNLGQQSRLFEAINSGRIGNDSASSLSVATKIRSKDLILIINNELKSQGKKPIS